MNSAPSRHLDKIMVRLPDGMRPKLSQLARSNHRSVNAEVVYHLEKVLAALGPREDDDGAVIGTATPSSSENGSVFAHGASSKPANGVPT